MTRLVRDLMTQAVETLAPEDDLVAADALMRRKRLRHLPVVRNGRLLGLITHRDLLRAQARILASLGSSEDERVVSIAAEDVMTRDVKTARPDDLAADAAARLLLGKFGCLPVVEEARLVGIVTESDFLRWALATMTP